ncbi:hypothetical protein DRE_06686 [Drechslerella stenobrocha 248]|uniref:Uncharacterized protein n=1 Tax=Drechslerella stenobrocha 248 TaxID=1043628 RepID=W7I6U0_9PEZI|nr:hypothetical protein DRE_06686 [Drechslerella stenobrocha 248]
MLHAAEIIRPLLVLSLAAANIGILQYCIRTALHGFERHAHIVSPSARESHPLVRRKPVSGLFPSNLKSIVGQISLVLTGQIDNPNARYCLADANLQKMDPGDFITLEECREGEQRQIWRTHGKGYRPSMHEIAYKDLIYSGWVRNLDTGRCIWAYPHQFENPGNLEMEGVGFQLHGFLVARDCEEGKPAELQMRFDPLDPTDARSGTHLSDKCIPRMCSHRRATRAR